MFKIFLLIFHSSATTVADVIIRHGKNVEKSVALRSGSCSALRRIIDETSAAAGKRTLLHYMNARGVVIYLNGSRRTAVCFSHERPVALNVDLKDIIPVVAPDGFARPSSPAAACTEIKTTDEHCDNIIFGGGVSRRGGKNKRLQKLCLNVRRKFESATRHVYVYIHNIFIGRYSKSRANKTSAIRSRRSLGTPGQLFRLCVKSFFKNSFTRFGFRSFE